MISSKKYVDETLRKYNLKANKALGQNFLVESDIASFIVESANIDKETTIIEIGPGMGALTEFELDKAKQVIAYEIDKNMVQILNDSFSNYDNFKLYNIDFLKVDLDKLFDNLKDEKSIKLISNLPYYITSKILNKLILYPLDELTVMMQKEVGIKLIKPAPKDTSVLTRMLSYADEGSIVKYVGKNSYLPRPDIDSIVLSFKSKHLERKKIDKFYNVCSALYSNRRKTISNNLKNLFDVETIDQILKECNLDENLRAEQLNNEQIEKISNWL